MWEVLKIFFIVREVLCDNRSERASFSLLCPHQENHVRIYDASLSIIELMYISVFVHLALRSLRGLGCNLMLMQRFHMCELGLIFTQYAIYETSFY